ncbi:MAG TPA: hypothetical protein VLG09_02645 [Candidatus Saccharimonadales bacterium]|nr:hypothetical protein [Candidatus Saccharimonadales bacterium]
MKQILTKVGTYDVSTIPPDGGLVRFHETCIFARFPAGNMHSKVVATYNTEQNALDGHAAIVATIEFITGQEAR